MTRRGFLAAGAAPLIGQPKKRPNILFVIADDWGYGHAGAYGGKWVNTPGFDRVARQGVSVHQHLHVESEVQPVPGDDPHRAELVADARRRSITTASSRRTSRCTRRCWKTRVTLSG